MIRSIVLGTIVGGIIAFAWSAISWTVLPWHKKSVKTIRNEEFVGWVVKENAKKEGIYVIPGMPSGHDKEAKSKWSAAASRGPYIFAAVSPKGISESMTPNIIIGAFTQLALAAIASFLLVQVASVTYVSKVVFVTLVGLFAGILANVPMWNWFSFPINFTAINLADSIITWFLAGLGMAAVMPKVKKKASSRK